MSDHCRQGAAGMKPPPADWKPAGETFSLSGLQPVREASRTTTDGVPVNGGPAKQASPTEIFNFGRHRWLARVARDEKLPGSALRTAVLLWELQNADRRCAWPSLTYIGAQLKMHRSTVIRSLRVLGRRGWITITHRGGRHRTNRISFGSMEQKDDPGWGAIGDGRSTATKRSHPGNETVAATHPDNRKDWLY
jgi:hypothetical protein